MKINIKKLILTLFLLLSFNSYAISPSNNDGSAFITKAEFDALKSSFQSQIDTYNQNIDSKIDNAIASYLSGIRIQKDFTLESYINKLPQKFINDNTITWPATTTGSYKKYFINIGLMHSYVAVPNTATQVQFLTGVINNPDWKTVNDSTNYYGKYYYGVKTSSGNYELQKWLYAKPMASVAGIITGGGTADYTSSSFTIPTKTFSCDSTDSLGTENDTWSLSIGGKTRDIAVVKSFSIEDTFNTLDLNYIPGTKLDTSDVYFVESKDITKPGSIREYLYNDKYGYEIRGATSSSDTSGTTYKGWTTGNTSTNTKLALYNHYYTSIKRSNIVNAAATSLMREDIMYYQGLPLFKNNIGKGKCTFKLKFTGSGNVYYKIQKSKFTDADVGTSGYVTTPEINKLCRTSSGTTLEFTIDDCDIDEEYWIKACPATAGTSYAFKIETVGDIILKYVE